MRTISTSPIVPADTASRTDLWAASNRRLKPICRGTPAFPTAANASSTKARSIDTGFSQKMALPAAAAAIINGTWVSVLEQMATASTSEDPRTSSAFVVCGTPSSEPTADAAAALMSWTIANVAPGTWRATNSACILPIRPTPRTPMRRVMILLSFVGTDVARVSMRSSVVHGSRCFGQ